MRARIGVIVVAVLATAGLLLAGAAASARAVAMSPTSGPSGTTATASSDDTCPDPPASTDQGVTNAGPVVLQQVLAASAAAPAAEDENWYYVTDDDGTIADWDAPWHGTFDVVAGRDQAALPPGSYTVYFACGYIPESPPSGGLPATDGAPVAYDDYTAKPFQVCAAGTQTCSTSGSSSTSSSSSSSSSSSTSSSSSSSSSTSTSTTVPSASSTTTPTAAAAPTSAARGDTLDITLSGWRPNSTGTIDLQSTPTRLGTFTVNSTGAGTATVKIPASTTPGAHHLVLTGVDASGAPRTVSVPVTVTGIVRTGTSVFPLLTVALALLLCGVVVRARTGDLRRAGGAHMRSR